MQRIQPIEHDHAPAKARELLDEHATRADEPGPMVRTIANSPALLRGYLDLNRAMKRSHLDRRITERIALAAQEWIGCEYCMAAHTAAAQKLGLSDRDVALARQSTATDPALLDGRLQPPSPASNRRPPRGAPHEQALPRLGPQPIASVQVSRPARKPRSQ